MIILFLVLVLTSFLAPLLIRALGPAAFGLLALPPAAGFLWLVSLFIRNDVHREYRHEWMPSAHLDIELVLDPLAGIFGLIILGMGTLVLLYCWGYFCGTRDQAPKRLQAFGAQMSAFAMAMFGLVISDNFLLMFVFWEITSVLSFLLVGYYSERASSRRSAGQALLVTTLGGLAMLVGIIALGVGAGTWRLSEITQHASFTHTPYATTAVVLILAGALSKSAIAPMHFWLPGAMAAPTPVSAYLHSAAMVKAGIYLVARVSPAFATVPTWHLAVIPLGIFTMLLAGWMALRQKDLKLILAYGTVSQLGFIMTLVGIGSRAALLAGLALTFSHALFKASLFMVVGAIDHTTGTRDIRKLSGLARKQPGLALIAVVSASSMAGIPPLLGFVAKESAIGAVLTEELLVGMPGKMTLTGIVAGSILTMAYALYFVWAAFATKPGAGCSPEVRDMHRVSTMLWLPPALLATTSFGLGLFPQLIDAPISAHLATVFPHSSSADHLSLWHGLTLPLAISAVILASGAVLHWQRDLVAKLHFEQPALGDANVAYDQVIDVLRRISLQITATTQRGSLPVNEAIILLTLVLLPLLSLVTGERTFVRMEMWDSPIQGFIALLVIIAAIAVTVLNNRVSALIMVGMTGYGISVIFALHGAPDLALTQMLVETISVLVFMLVLRKFPASAERTSDTPFVRARAWLSVAVGVTVMVIAVFAMNARETIPVSIHIPDLAKNIGHGANAVNVLLIDIRAWDTLGEISVLVVVATGVASLVYRTRDFSRESRRPTLLAEGGRWLATSDSERMRNRSLMTEVATRILFPSMLALSAYFFFAGHNGPGGGFAGGLVAALAFSLRYLAGGRRELEEALPVDPSILLGIGLLLSSATAVIPMFFGLAPLTSRFWEFHPPLIEHMAIVSPFAFDAGVYLIVIGLILHVVQSLGSQLDRDEEARVARNRSIRTEV